MTTTGRPGSRVAKPSIHVSSWFNVDSACCQEEQVQAMLEWHMHLILPARLYCRACAIYLDAMAAQARLLIAAGHSHEVVGACPKRIDLGEGC